MKAILNTKGNFLLLDPSSGQEVPYHRPAVVEVTNFFQARLGIGQLEVIHANLPDIADDKELAACIKEHGVDEGVETYLLTLAALTATPDEDEASFEPETLTTAKAKTDGDPV